MRRATQIALLTVLCWFGLGQASRITWGPKRDILKDEVSWTTQNNTWAVTGNMDTAVAVIVKNDDQDAKAVWSIRTTNRGRTWAEPYPLSDVQHTTYDSASAPTIVRFGPDSLIAVWLQFRSGRGEVWCARSFGLPPL